MVVMGVRDQYSLGVFGNLIEQRSGVPTVLARVHSCVKKDGVLAGPKEVGVCPDFRGTSQVRKGDHADGSRGERSGSERSAELREHFGWQLVFWKSRTTGQPIPDNFTPALGLELGKNSRQSRRGGGSRDGIPLGQVHCDEVLFCAKRGADVG